MLVRKTSEADIPAIDELLSRGYPELLKKDYAASVLESALPLITTARPELVTSDRYFVAVLKDRIISAGGWSTERPTGGQEAGLGHIRHVVSDPEYVRRGAAKAVMAATFEDAHQAGVTRMECFSTLSAVPFYQAMGFVTLKRVMVPIGPDGIGFESVLMFAQI